MELKDWIGVLAFFLAAGGFGYTWRTNREQNRRWNSLNLARVVVKDLNIVGWREMARAEFEATKWGYFGEPLAISGVSASALVDTSKVRVLTGITAIKKTSNELFSDVFQAEPSAITTEEMTSALVKRGANPSEWTLVKRYQINYALENVGKTVASSVVARVTLSADTPMVGSVPPGDPLELGPNEPKWAWIAFRAPVESGFPSGLRIRFLVEYRDNNGKQTTIPYLYEFDKRVGSFRQLPG